MQPINVLHLTSHVNDWMAGSSHPRILHIFDRACNLINEHRQVLSIVTPQIGNGPFNLVVEKDVCFTEYLSLQSSISISSNKIILGELGIHTANAHLWSPRPDWEGLYDNREKIVNQLMKLSLPKNQPLLPQSLLSNLSLALANQDLSSAQKATSRLAGLGAGLTPAGDDFIMGALYSVWIIHPCEVAASFSQAIANTATLLTTSLSAAWLKSAASGEAGVLWHRFFEVLVGPIDNPTYLQEAMNNILAVGETSGGDALAGFLGTTISWAALPRPK